MWWHKSKSKRHYALMLKSTENGSLKLYYQIFNEDGYQVEIIDADDFEEAQDKYSRLTVLFTSAKRLGD